MDGKLEEEKSDVENDTEEEATEDYFDDKEKTSLVVGRSEKAGVPAEVAAQDHEENAEAATKLPLENISGNELDDVSNITADEHVDVTANEVHEQPASHKRDSHTPAQQDPADREHISYEEYAQLLQELHEERHRAVQRSTQLQMNLFDYFRKKAGDDPQLEKEAQVSEQLRDYEKHLSILTEMRQQLAAETGTAQQEAEELRVQAQEKLDKVEKVWRAFMKLKQDVAVTVLSRSLGKQAAQDKVEKVLAGEQLQQDQLTTLRIKYIKLGAKIQRLKAGLQDERERGRDPLQLQFEQLKAERLERKKQAEKQSEESSKLQKNISSGLELLSNVKEKLHWNQMDVQAKREQLAQTEAAVARKRDLLTKTKQARSSLQRDNQRLKESRGLLGNRVLLRDFEDTVDDADHLEEQLENLNLRWSLAARWKKPEPT